MKYVIDEKIKKGIYKDLGIEESLNESLVAQEKSFDLKKRNANDTDVNNVISLSAIPGAIKLLVREGVKNKRYKNNCKVADEIKPVLNIIRGNKEKIKR